MRKILSGPWVYILIAFITFLALWASADVPRTEGAYLVIEFDIDAEVNPGVFVPYRDSLRYPLPAQPAQAWITANRARIEADKADRVNKWKEHRKHPPSPMPTPEPTPTPEE